jgi:predicted glycoside hydrolase/deacetylase ChbG (UPF0249 family)
VSERVLVVTADDFGLSAGVNRGVGRAHEHGIVTSASLMVCQPAAADAARYARRAGTLALGLHFEVGEWEYRDGEWHTHHEFVPVDDDRAVGQELDRQLELFTELTGGLPTHIDSHQHVHRDAPVGELVARAGALLGVPVRDVTPGITYVGGFYGQDGKGGPLPDAITVDALLAIIRSLPAGVTELGCHPAMDDDIDTMYRHERLVEVESLCAPRVRAAIDEEAIALRGFADVATTPSVGCDERPLRRRDRYDELGR